jgi:hypothetical protein
MDLSGTRVGLFLVLAAMVAGDPASAQIEENLSSYGEANAQGYLEPLKDAIGSALGDGLYPAGSIPREGVHFRFSMQAMLVSFGDDDRTFTATTEPGFPAPQQAEAATVAGATEATIVEDSGSGAKFAFPGGLDLARFGLAVPQITAAGFGGNEITVRYLAFETGDGEIGDFSLFGIGGRHDLSQHLTDLPLRVAAMVFYQNLSLGDDLIDHSIFSVGLQASRRFRLIEPYAGIALDSSSMSASYENDRGANVDLDFDSDNQLDLALGSVLHFGLLRVNGEVHLSDQVSYAFGLSVGN